MPLGSAQRSKAASNRLKTVPPSFPPIKSGATSVLNVNFTPQAQDDLRAIRAWIADEDERAADRVIARIRQTILMFEAFPMLGHEGDVSGTREFKVTGLPYLIVYQIASATDLDILTILHQSRNYP